MVVVLPSGNQLSSIQECGRLEAVQRNAPVAAGARIHERRLDVIKQPGKRSVLQRGPTCQPREQTL